MNRKTINFEILQEKELPTLTQEVGGEKYNKWSFINIYSLQDLKDIYLITQKADKKTVKEMTAMVNELIGSKGKWEERKVLEYLNAMVKLGLTDHDYKSRTDYFHNSYINEPLSENDKFALRNLFFEYFRFKEISAWFVSPVTDSLYNLQNFTKLNYVNDSFPLYFCSERTRFTDTFFADIENPKLKLIIKDEIVMRFWDVFLKWGTTLEIIEKFNLSKVIKSPPSTREISMAYFIKPFNSFDLVDFMQTNFHSCQVPIPELIFKVVKNFRYSVKELKSFIVSEVLNNQYLTYERTSEVFITKGANTDKRVLSTTYLYPKINNSFISHLILRR